MPAANDFEMMKLITGGDLESEIDLLTSFRESSREFLVALREAFASESNEAWRQAAHAMKGSSYNLGANALGETCQDTMKKYEAPQPEKEKILVGVASEVALLETVVTKMIEERQSQKAQA